MILVLKTTQTTQILFLNRLNREKKESLVSLTQPKKTVSIGTEEENSDTDYSDNDQVSTEKKTLKKSPKNIYGKMAFTARYKGPKRYYRGDPSNHHSFDNKDKDLDQE